MCMFHGQAEPPDATTDWRSGGSDSRDPVNGSPGCWDSHRLRSKEDEDFICRIDCKDAGSGPHGNITESSRNANERFSAGVKAPDSVVDVDEPDPIPASLDLRGISPYFVEQAADWIVAKDMIGAVDSPYVIHSHGDLGQEA